MQRSVAWVLFVHTLRRQWRQAGNLVHASLFAAMLVILASFAFYMRPSDATRIGAGALWLSLYFASTLVMARDWRDERELDAFALLLHSPCPTGWLFFTKAMSNWLMLIVVQCFLLPLTALLFSLPIGPVLLPLAAVFLLGSLGFTLTCTLFMALGLRRRQREMLLTVAVFPLSAPALLGSVVATRELLNGAALSAINSWLGLLVAFDLLALAAGLLLFEALVRE